MVPSPHQTFIATEFLTQCHASVAHQDVHAARMIAGGVLVLAEVEAAPGAVQPAAGPLVLLRVGRNDRVEKGHARRAGGPAVALVLAALESLAWTATTGCRSAGRP